MCIETNIVNNIEESINKYGSTAWKCKGFSMEPLIHADTDFVVIEKAVHPLEKYDVALYVNGGAYNNSDRKYILHRVIKTEKDRYIILGDNCTYLEYVPKGQVIGVMRDLVRAGRQVRLGGIKYNLYMNFWIKPWRMRIMTIKVRNKLRRVWWKFVDITAPYTPRPVKEAVKRIIKLWK